MLLLPRQSVARSALVNWSRYCPPVSSASRSACAYSCGRRRHHGNERHPQQRREVRLRNGRRPRRCLDDGGALTDPAVAQRIKEQRARQPVFEAAGDVCGLVLEVELDVDAVAPGSRQRIPQQVGVGAASGVSLDQPDRVVHPRPWLAASGFCCRCVHCVHCTAKRRRSMGLMT